MHHQLLFVLGLLFVVFLLVMLAQKIRIAYPIFLVIGGLGISFVPGMPMISLNPDLIFLLFLPPLLYEAAWFTSWNDFWKAKRPIALLAFGLVFFTSMVVAYSSVALIPGFTLAMGFLLGGIVSPPDAVAAATVLKGIKVPKRILTILEGESLVNDASSLIVFRFALAAIITGTFSLQQATGSFFLMAGMGIVVGLVIANILYLIHRFLPTTSAIDAALTLMTPYFMYLAAEQFHYSGVMAVVSGGLFLSYRSHEVFNNGATRLNMQGVWTTVIFVLNALVFILIGLELPVIVAGLGESSIMQGIGYGIIISFITIVVRFIWIYPATYIPRFLSKSIRTREPNPGWKGPFIVASAGMRGVVSLATALSIPLMLKDGTEFPMRNLILLITFIVIFVTLVFQGLLLPLIIRLIKIDTAESETSHEQTMAGNQANLNKIAIKRLKENYELEVSQNSLVSFYKIKMENNLNEIEKQFEAAECNPAFSEDIVIYHKVLKDIYSLQRKELFRMRREKIFDDDGIRKMEMQLDLDDMKITNSIH